MYIFFYLLLPSVRPASAEVAGVRGGYQRPPTGAILSGRLGLCGVAGRDSPPSHPAAAVAR